MSDVLLWLDIETTGLEPANDAILEIGIQATDWELKPIMDPISLVVHDAIAEYCPLSDIVKKMHTTNHLLDDVADPYIAVTPNQAKRLLRSHIEKLLEIYPDPSQVMLAGSSVHFDKRFLDHQYPGLLTGLSHRIMDVSVLDEIARHENTKVFQQRPPKTTNHRVLACLRDSTALYDYYRHNLLISKVRPYNPNNIPVKQ